MKTEDEDMLPEYNFDYSKAKPNRFAKKPSSVIVTLDADMAEIFKESEAVNKALRAIVMALPESRFRKETNNSSAN